jgi:hypothetical protein
VTDGKALLPIQNLGKRFVVLKHLFDDLKVNITWEDTNNDPSLTDSTDMSHDTQFTNGHSQAAGEKVERRQLSHHCEASLAMLATCRRHVGNVSKSRQIWVGMQLFANTKSTPTQEFCIGNHRQIVDTVVCTDTVVHTPRGGKIL